MKINSMFRGLILVLSLFLVFSCDNDETDKEKKVSNLGSEGYNCKEDKTCNSELICNRNNICEKDSDLGKKGKSCKADKTCNTGLVCNDQNICEYESSDNNKGKEGYACKDDKTCNTGLTCNSENICEEKQTGSDLGKEGKECRGNGTCNYDLFCNDQNICEKENVADFGKEGKPCLEFGACDSGLMCALENICLNETDFHTGDIGQKCRVTEDSFEYCYEGLTCNSFGKCDIDCSIGNDILCTEDGMFDFTPYPGKYLITRFDESTTCGANDYVSKIDDLSYDYFELIFENYYGFKYLSYHDCSSSSNCSSAEKPDYKIVEYDGQNLMETATENEDGSCTYRSIDTKIRKIGNMVRMKYIFEEFTDSNPSDDCLGNNVKNHYAELECAKIRIIDGEL